jgi:methionyl-tRNA formyltransferase
MNKTATSPINLVFFGTPKFSTTILEALLKEKGINLVGVVTQKDKPVGRKGLITPSPVALKAKELNLPLFKPNKLDQSNLEHIKLLKPDLFLVVAYGQIIPPVWLNTPSIATLNIHYSLLPKYRGALCVSEAIKNQDKKTGVTLMKMDQDLDHGPIIAQKKQTIDIADNVETLTQKLTQKSLSLLPLLTKVKTLTYTPQDHSKATTTPLIKSRTRNSAFIKTLKVKNPESLHALIRSLNPEPGAWTKINDQELKILETRLIQKDSKKPARLEITKLQLPGKNPITWRQFDNRKV